ncbi:GNAT family N-acetyltransferase [Salinibacillus xinjiangensis]|uniref:GNAT family N-acetyltransferase n=1 Tax=Salinibacillus xinjiangensis TaxID=1229268 RepID=A0A6G1X178_9BACI|nr:GNAT family N-acetyltransferase [Salinibacillus xinjiangensis]MRG84712.1 GNAT family N-acetyltransferase [Salinibacillus xinjiangensis]
MIRPLNLQDDQVALDILDIQKFAYQIEAKRIGYPNLPPLLEWIDDIQQVHEHFYGFYAEETLAGFISIEFDRNVMTICRLAVHPNFFRRGIAQKLLRYVLKNTSAKTCLVSTAAKNKPAIKLYEKNGFIKHRTVSKDEQLSLIELVRRTR